MSRKGTTGVFAFAFLAAGVALKWHGDITIEELSCFAAVSVLLAMW